MMLLRLRKLGNIWWGHKMFLNKIRNIFCVPDTKCVCNKCCARGQTGKHLCRQQCVRNNASSFARASKHEPIVNYNKIFDRDWFPERLICHVIGSVITGVWFKLVELGYPRDFHVNYVRFDRFLRNVFYSFQNTDVFAQNKFTEDIFNSEICYRHD